MKKNIAGIILICYVCFLGQTRADSLVGGDISYTYIGDSTGIPNQYLVDVGIQYTSWNSGSTTAMTPPVVCIQSSCFTGFTVGSMLHPNMPTFPLLIGNNECLHAIDPSFLPVFRIFFQATVTLPDTCSDITFTVNQCCRLPDSSLVNYAQSGEVFLQATLNNTYGNRSAPLFIPNQYALSFCHQGVYHSHGINNIMDDSVVFRLKPLQQGNCTNTIPSVDLSFAIGYTDSVPFAVHSNSQLDVIQPGIISFKPASVNGNFAYGVEFDIYTQIPNSPGNYYLLGTIHREEVISIGSQCHIPYVPFPAPGIHTYEMIPTSVLRMLPYSDFIPNTDSVPDPNSPSGYSMEWVVYEYGCYDTIPTLISGSPIICHSISPDGSEFSVYGPDTAVVPVVSARGLCNPFGLAYRLEYEFASRLNMEGDYYVTIMKGTDNNTFFNHCSFEMMEYFTFILRNTCPSDFSVSSFENASPIKVYPNPNSGVFNLIADGRVYHRAELYDLQGRVIHKTALSRQNEHQLNVGNIAPGQYLLWLFNDDHGVREAVKMLVH